MYVRLKEVRMGEKKNQKGQRWYLAVDLKSFYSSVECRERDLDPLDPGFPQHITM